MKKIVALGTFEFVRLMQYGGAEARLADAGSLPGLLETALADPAAGILLLDAALAQAVPDALRDRMSASSGPRVLIFGEESSALLRSRIRQVAGADLMAAGSGTGKAR